MRKILLGLMLAAAGLAGLGTINEAAASGYKKTTTVARSQPSTYHSTTQYHNSTTHYQHSTSHYGNTSHYKSSQPYYRTYGVKYSKGFYFTGRNHNHWGHRKWDSYRRTYVYWEPTLQVYYYYDEVQGGYYPCD